MIEMFVNATGYYVPDGRIDNSVFSELNGLTDEWIVQRTGIKSRSKGGADENINTMSVAAVYDALPHLPYNIGETDLIISASYSPYDTVVTAAHFVQHEFGIEDAHAFYLSSACSSFLNALEVAEGYFSMGKASKALILSADKNSDYCNYTDSVTGHLWGDAAVAFFLSKEQHDCNEAKILDIYTRGLGHLPKAGEAVHLYPKNGGISMPYGKDVFTKACTYMPQSLKYLLNRHGYSFESLSYIITHQANLRIMNNIAQQLGLPETKFLHNISELGNTGSVSSALVYAQNAGRFKSGELVGITVFGGGYSTGAALIQI